VGLRDRRSEGRQLPGRLPDHAQAPQASAPRTHPEALAAAEPATKQRALLLCDLATCQVLDGEPEEAARQAAIAFGIGSQCGSAKVVQQVRAVRTQVAATGHRRALAYLDERLLAGMLTEF
jgi:hypothetical protein